MAINLILAMLLLPVNPIRIIRRGPFSADNNMEQLEALVGTNLVLNCTVVLESNDQLYSLKWYRRRRYGSSTAYYDEFYSYISSPNETIHHAELAGITLDQDGRNGQVIRMIDISRQTEGIYRCEAISDELFQVDRKEFNVTVLVPPMEPPRILAVRQTYRMGDLVQLQCLAGKTKPLMRWYLATGPVYPPPESDESQLQFYLSPEHLTGMKNRFAVRCVSYMEETARFQQQEQEGNTAEAGGPDDSLHRWWNPVKPVIEGLQEELQLGDIIRARCTIPYNNCLNHLKLARFALATSRSIQWEINGKKPNAGYVIRYGLFASELCFRLERHHLDENGSLSLGCTSVTRFPNDQDLIALLRNDPDPQPTANIHEQPEEEEKTNSTNLFFGKLTVGNPEMVFKSIGAILIPMAAIMVMVAVVA